MAPKKQPGKGVIRLGERHIDSIAQQLFNMGYLHVVIAVRKGAGHDDRFKTYTGLRGDPLAQWGMLETLETLVQKTLAEEEGRVAEDSSEDSGEEE